MMKGQTKRIYKITEAGKNHINKIMRESLHSSIIPRMALKYQSNVASICEFRQGKPVTAKVLEVCKKGFKLTEAHYTNILENN